MTYRVTHARCQRCPWVAYVNQSQRGGRVRQLADHHNATEGHRVTLYLEDASALNRTWISLVLAAGVLLTWWWGSPRILEVVVGIVVACLLLVPRRREPEE